MATYADKLVEYIDPLWFLLVFPECFPNEHKLHDKKVSIEICFSFLIQIDGSPFQSNALFLLLVNGLSFIE